MYAEYLLFVSAEYLTILNKERWQQLKIAIIPSFHILLIGS